MCLRAVLKWLSKNQNQSNRSDQSQQEQAAQFLAITCNSLEAREKSPVHGAIGFGFASHWLKNRRESFKPITKRSNRNHVTTFDTYLKSALNFLIDNMTQPPFALLFKTEWYHISLLLFVESKLRKKFIPKKRMYTQTWKQREKLETCKHTRDRKKETPVNTTETWAIRCMRKQT